MLTHVLVLPPGPDGFWALIIGLLFVWLGGAQFEQRYGSKRMLQLCAAGTVGAGLGALVLGLLAHSAGMNSGALLGPSALWLALFIGYMTTMGQQQISFFGIFPLRADQVVWLFVGLSVLQQVFSTNPSALGGDLGAMASGVLFVRWMQNPPRKGGGKKRRKAGKKRGKRGPLRVVRDDEEPPNYLN